MREKTNITKPVYRYRTNAMTRGMREALKIIAHLTGVTPTEVADAQNP